MPTTLFSHAANARVLLPDTLMSVPERCTSVANVLSPCGTRIWLRGGRIWLQSMRIALAVDMKIAEAGSRCNAALVVLCMSIGCT